MICEDSASLPSGQFREKLKTSFPGRAMLGRVMKFKIIWSTQDMTGRAPEGAPVLGRTSDSLWARTLEQEGDPDQEGVPMISLMLDNLFIYHINTFYQPSTTELGFWGFLKN